MTMPFRTRLTILIFAIPGLLDEYWLGNRYLDLPSSLRRPVLVSVEGAMLLLLLVLVMWSFTARRLSSRSAGFLFTSAVLMDPTGDPLLKPHLFEVGGLVFAAMMIGIEGQAARRYFDKVRKSRDEERESPA